MDLMLDLYILDEERGHTSAKVFWTRDHHISLLRPVSSSHLVLQSDFAVVLSVPFVGYVHENDTLSNVLTHFCPNIASDSHAPKIPPFAGNTVLSGERLNNINGKTEGRRITIWRYCVADPSYS